MPKLAKLRPAFDAPLAETAQSLAIKAHTASRFPQEEVVEVLPGKVWSAIGYALGNTVLVKATQGCVLVDSTEAKESAEKILQDFETQVPGFDECPILAVLQTHNHADHVWGSGAFVDYAKAKGDDPDVWCHETTPYYSNVFSGLNNNVIVKRSVRQFGIGLPFEEKLNAGIGPTVNFGAPFTVYPSVPMCTRFLVGEEETVDLGGVDFTIRHSPGETEDQLSMWIPEYETLLVGDNFYSMFPNLYAIRGTVPRNTLNWVSTLDYFRNLGAEHMVPSHTRPISGRYDVLDALTVYRDAIQIVHDQTCRFMDRDLSPDEFVSMVKLPQYLEEHSLLQPFYGSVDWSVRHVYEGYLGWFDGNPAKLRPLAKSDSAERWLKLVGKKKLEKEARKAYNRGEYQWALEMADVLNEAEPSPSVSELLVACLKRKGELAPGPNDRHWYLVKAREMEGLLLSRNSTKPAEKPVLLTMPAWAVRVDPVKAQDVDQAVVFHFTDATSAPWPTWTLYVRRGVCLVQQSAFPSRPAGVTDSCVPGTFPPQRYADMEVTLDRQSWVEIMYGHSVASKSLLVADGDKMAFQAFVDLFDPLKDVWKQPSPLPKSRNHGHGHGHGHRGSPGAPGRSPGWMDWIMNNLAQDETDPEE